MMLLPERLRELPVREWNEIIRRVVFAWDLAKAFGCESAIEQLLASEDGDNSRAAEFLAFLVSGLYPLSSDGWSALRIPQSQHTGED